MVGSSLPDITEKLESGEATDPIYIAISLHQLDEKDLPLFGIDSCPIGVDDYKRRTMEIVSSLNSSNFLKALRISHSLSLPLNHLIQECNLEEDSDSHRMRRKETKKTYQELEDEYYRNLDLLCIPNKAADAKKKIDELVIKVKNGDYADDKTDVGLTDSEIAPHRHMILALHKAFTGLEQKIMNSEIFLNTVKKSPIYFLFRPKNPYTSLPLVSSGVDVVGCYFSLRKQLSGGVATLFSDLDPASTSKNAEIKQLNFALYRITLFEPPSEEINEKQFSKRLLEYLAPQKK